MRTSFKFFFSPSSLIAGPATSLYLSSKALAIALPACLSNRLCMPAEFVAPLSLMRTYLLLLRVLLSFTTAPVLFFFFFFSPASFFVSQPHGSQQPTHVR
jgi:hypothetical protein